MVRKKKQKIAFYYLTINSQNITAAAAFKQILDYIKARTRARRRYLLGDNKFCLLDTLTIFQDGIRNRIIFKSATYNSSPDLIHKETVNERESPKQLQEGEVKKTHIVTKDVGGEVVFLMEKHNSGIQVQQFIKYLNHFASESNFSNNFRFSFDVMLKDNFLEEISHLNRVVCAEVHVDKQLLGSAAMNYSNRISQVQSDVVVTVKAVKRASIENFVRDAYAKLSGSRQSITKMRIVGRNQENNEVVVNTDFIERQEFIMAEVISNTGQLASNSVFLEIETIMQNAT